jgi:hypothetical protein
VSEPQPLRPGDRVTVVEGGAIKRGVVSRSAPYNIKYVLHHFAYVDLLDEHVEAKFSNTTASPALQQLRQISIEARHENKTWVRGWVDEEEAKAIFVAEALA